jgi:hypothetical protein
VPAVDAQRPGLRRIADFRLDLKNLQHAQRAAGSPLNR